MAKIVAILGKQLGLGVVGWDLLPALIGRNLNKFVAGGKLYIHNLYVQTVHTRGGTLIAPSDSEWRVCLQTTRQPSSLSPAQGVY